MQDVAERAGVSIATVSFVVNGTKRVAPATRDRVTAAMRELGYRGNVVARALASRRTRIIALMFPAPELRFGQTALHFFTAAASRAAELGHHLVLWPSDATGDDVQELWSGGLADGVIVMEISMEDARIDRLVELGVPFVAIGRTADPSALPFVDIDFERTVEAGLDHLIALGHRNVGLVIEDFAGTPLDGYAPHIRSRRTFRESAERRGITATIVSCGPSAAGGRQAARDLLDAAPGITAVMIMKDDSTQGLVRGFESAGLRVPEDVSVLSLASSNEAGAATEPALSTMNAPGEELGRLAATSLIERLEGAAIDVPHVLIPCELHVADSTAPARTRDVTAWRRVPGPPDR